MIAWARRVQRKYRLLEEAVAEVEELIDPKFRYTFSNKTITNLSMPAGLYQTDFRGDKIVLNVDKFGEVRVAQETPCGNPDRLAHALKKSR